MAKDGGSSLCIIMSYLMPLWISKLIVQHFIYLKELSKHNGLIAIESVMLISNYQWLFYCASQKELFKGCSDFRGQQAMVNSYSLPDFVNMLLSEHSHPHLVTKFWWFHLGDNGKGRYLWLRLWGPQSLKYFSSDFLHIIL